jgi:LacI family transcriptional regulator
MKHVALLIETSSSYGRGLLHGISKYNRAHGRWSTYIRPQGMNDDLPEWLARWSGDGILVRMRGDEVARSLRKVKVPIVNLRSSRPRLPYPCFIVNNAEVVKLAIQHFVDRGLKEFAFCGVARGRNSVLDERADLFQQFLDAEHRRCQMLTLSKSAGSWEQEQEQISAWIRELPKPVGIMAANDERGLQVLDACRRCEIHVPDQIAVLGVDNDEPLCDLAIPPLASVDVNAEGIGFEAAALLERVMGGDDAEVPDVTEIMPRGVVTRRSTDVIASEDEDVNRAVQYIRQEACNGLRVLDVLNHTAMSRATLHQRMKNIIGSSVHQEIQRVRLNRAKELLVMSPLRIKQVARESGFASVEYMTRVFRSACGETPLQYRLRRTR